MLLIIAIFALYTLLQKVIIDRSLIRRIKKSENVDEAIRFRVKLKFRRRIFLCMYLAVVLCAFTGLSILAMRETGKFDVNDWGWVITLPAFIYYYLVANKNLERLVGNLSTLDKATFLSRTGEYALYLRGFEMDDYTPESKYLAREKDMLRRLKKNTKIGFRFSEYYFTRVLQSRIPVCAVGMTKEIEAPMGALRVYLNDGTWKEDVRELMEHAKEIYILVNDRPSCVWEIEQSWEMLDKTVFLIDDRCRYARVRGLWARNDMPLPVLPTPAYEYPINDFVALKVGNGSVDCKSYENSIVGYSRLLERPVPKKRKSKIGCGCLCVVLLSFLVWGVIGYIGIDQELTEKQQSREIVDEYLECQNHDLQLPIDNVLGCIRILPPKDGVEIGADTKLFSQLAALEDPQCECFKRFYDKRMPTDGDSVINGAMDILTLKCWKDKTFTLGDFRRQIAAERQSVTPGAVLRDEVQTNALINGTLYNQYMVKARVMEAASVTDTAFQYSTQITEVLVANAQTQKVHTITSVCFSLIKDKILLLRARSVTYDENEARAIATRHTAALKQWGEVLQACNKIDPKQIGVRKKDEEKPSQSDNAKLDGDEAVERNQGTGMIIPMLLVGGAYWAIRRFGKG